MDSANTIEREMTIDADAATVFAFFTDPERLVRWIGVSANLEPHPGGLLLIDVREDHRARGEFKEVVPVTRLAYTWGWEDNHQNVAPGSSLIEIDLSPKNGSTVVHFRHSGLPAAAVPGHREGWNHYLGRLVLAASGKDPGPDPLSGRLRPEQRN
ncbi:MAG TPA: SRPBCC domain-containing protein [Candidatus Binataceae bacterium]|nr:SRPBCC domain-containing protein [Candidatus Binataceae bacterium]